MFIKKLFSAALLTGVVFGVAAANAGTVITLDPTAANAGAPGGMALDPGTPAYQTDNLHGNLTSVLQINAGGTPVRNYTESGTIQLDQALLNNVTQLSNLGRTGHGGTYDVYLTFLVSGAGIFATPNLFSTTSVNLSVNVWGSPSAGTAFSNSTPANSTDPLGGSTQGSKDFLLATASIIADPTNFGIATIGNGLSGTAATSLSALLAFSPVAGTTGVGGFFAAPIPFAINFGSSSSSNTLESTFLIDGSGNVIITTGAQLSGTANITPTAVPEPGALSLVGLGLVAAGLVRSRKRMVAAG